MEKHKMDVRLASDASVSDTIGSCILWACVGFQLSLAYMAYREFLASRIYKQRLARLSQVAQSDMRQARESAAEESKEA